MKTNIFYKVAAVTNSSPKLGGESRYSIRRKASVLCTLCAVLLLAACTQDDIAPAYNDAPLTVTATIPGDVWAVASRFGIDKSNTDVPGGITVTVISYSDWTLHYTNYRGQAASGDLTATPSQDGTYTLTSGSDLVWAKVQDTQDADETFCLTCVGSDGATYYATTTAAHGAATVAFTTAMKPTLAKLTVNFTLSHNMAQVDYSDFTISVTAKAAKTSTADEVVYNPMTHGGTWPVAEGDAATTAFTLSQQSAADGTYTVTSSMLLPQQTMGETLTVTYNNGTADNFEDDISWTLNLSAVAVTGGVEGQMANQLIAGQHLTLNLSTSIHTVGAPGDIQIKAFIAADADSYTPDLGGVPKTYKYDADNNTYYIYHEKCIEAALADRAANNRTNAAIVSKAPTLAVVNGAETDLATVQAAISEKTHIIVTGTELAYSNGTDAETVVCKAINQLEEGTTVSLVLPEVTEIGKYAFLECKPLTSVSAPEASEILVRAFYGCTALTSVSAPKARQISKSSFGNCTALTSLTFGTKIEGVDTNAFYQVPTENCDLTLAAGQEHIDTSTGLHNGMPVTAADASADAAARTWAGATWKSITLK